MCGRLSEHDIVNICIAASHGVDSWYGQRADTVEIDYFAIAWRPILSLPRPPTSCGSKSFCGTQLICFVCSTSSSSSSSSSSSTVVEAEAKSTTVATVKRSYCSDRV